jgi:S1-C subfamily serine protease
VEGDAAVDLSRRPALGVTFYTRGDAMVISRVYPNSPAARMGLMPGDRIVSLNGVEFDDTDLFITAAGEVVLDEDAEIIYLRDGQRYTGTVRFMPWNSVYVDEDELDDLDDDDFPRRVGRPDLDDELEDEFDD